jgi:hypothetical protein
MGINGLRNAERYNRRLLTRFMQRGSAEAKVSLLLNTSPVFNEAAS